MECGACKLDIGFLDGQRMHHLVLELVGHLQWLTQFHGIHSLNVFKARLPDLEPQEGGIVEDTLYEEVTVDVLVDSVEEQEELLPDV